ncbi:MAG: ABC transporter permease subunit [Planctomycetota bacterium]|jgi:phosphonate transport system permease protein|nr:ABC transporter permease subunit [Planctomycetota bacterium]
MSLDSLQAPPSWGHKTTCLAILLLAAVASWFWLELSLTDVVPSRGGWLVARDFLSRALSPAWKSEAHYIPPGTPSLPWIALGAAAQTLLFAAAAMGLAIPLGGLLGFLASSAWWSDEMIGRRNKTARRFRQFLCPIIWTFARVQIALLRSIHEILWAILFLAALGLSPMAAVLAIALPFSGVLAKIYSELIDEAPRAQAHALRSAGASTPQIYLFGLVTPALPDMIAYTFYRFECAVRSSAVLGFFGFPTLGLYIRQSSASLNHGETWTYLYVLIATILLLEIWSGSVRRRLLS